MTEPVSAPCELSPPQMEELAFGYAAAKNGRSAERAIAFCTEDFVFRVACAPALTVSGRAAAAAHLTALWSVFPDLYSRVDNHVVGPRGLVAIGALSGTMRGDYLGVPATGRAFEVPLVSAFEYDEGSIRKETNFIDSLALYSQIGVPLDVVTALFNAVP
jgi:steroid delta-isomerase-like uncharacterized protein